MFRVELNESGFAVSEISTTDRHVCGSIGGPRSDSIRFCSKGSGFLVFAQESLHLKGIWRAGRMLVLNLVARVHRSLANQARHEDVLDTLPEAYDQALYAQKCSALFEHIDESYPERDAGIHSTAA